MIKYFEKRYVVTEGGCWLWTGSVTGEGYGEAYIDGQRIAAHRLAYALFIDDIEDDACVLHRCDVTRCVNPDHLFSGSQAINVADMDSKGRRRSVVSEKAHFAKLTWAEVRLIRQLHARGEMGCRKLGRRFNVSKNNIQAIVNGRTWVEET